MGGRVSRSNPPPLDGMLDQCTMYPPHVTQHLYTWVERDVQYELGSHPKAQKLTVDRSQIQTAKFGV